MTDVRMVIGDEHTLSDTPKGNLSFYVHLACARTGVERASYASAGRETHR